MLLVAFSTLVTLVSSVTAYSTKGRRTASLFCFTSRDCPDMQFCGKHRCRLPLTLREYLTVSKIYASRQRHISSEGLPCKRHIDCKQSGYICDIPDGVCRRFELVFSKINKCKDFKKPCRTNSDCFCRGKRMICEAESSGTTSECVIREARPVASRKRKAQNKRKQDYYEIVNF